MISKAILKQSINHLSGFLPVYKPKNICANKILTSLKYDVHFVLRQYDVPHGIIGAYYAKDLEFFADGLITFIIGNSNFRRRNFVFADYEYKAKVEFGVKRQFDTIDGQGISIAKTNNLSGQLIEKAIEEFIGEVRQRKVTTFAREEQPRIDGTHELSQEAVYDAIRVPETYKLEKQPQKYPLEFQEKVSVCHDIKLIDYHEPYATLAISCRKNFFVSQFASDLGKSLKTEASLVGLTRLKEGPMHLDDLRVLQLHELSLDNYIQRLDLYRDIYNDHLKQFDTMFENESTWRQIW